MEIDFHAPVLREEVIKAFEEQTKPPTYLLEGTFGRGGHTRVLLEHFPRLKVVSFDRDARAIEQGQKFFEAQIKSGRLVLIQDDFRNFGQHDLPSFDGALVDLGVSSPQLDSPERGFSFMHDGPLDMRMDQRQEVTAADLVNQSSEEDLIEIFKEWGEVRSPYRVVRALVHDRKTKPFLKTSELAGLIGRVEGWRKKGFHPATPFFMALRIAVNQELTGLGESISELVSHTNTGGRVCVISFHSLEDRIIKNIFKGLHGEKGKVINKKVITPSEEELKANPRSRSAKLRIFERQAPER